MHRFFVPPQSIAGEFVSIVGGAAHQIARVLRFKPGDRIVVLDGTGEEYETEILAIEDRRVEGKVVSKAKGAGEPAVNVTLCQALIKADKFELVLQKGVELGVSHFRPFVSERCVALKPTESKLERWRAIIREAAEQSRRATVPTLHAPVSFQALCSESTIPSLVLWEGEKSTGMAQALRIPAFREAQGIRVFVGPEGGFAESEIAMARGRGMVVGGMGRRILRAETAGLVALSAIMYERGELG